LYQAWATWVSGILTARGWDKTADTGQIDTATVSTPGAVDAEAGYEIRTSPTSGHTTFYIKVWYRTGYTATVPCISLEVGTGSDGAGALTGVTSAAHGDLAQGWAVGYAAPYSMNLGIHGDDDSLWFHALDPVNPSVSSWTGLERTTNATTGVSTDEGVLITGSWYTTTARWQCILWGGAGSLETVPGTLRLVEESYGGNTATILPVFVYDGVDTQRQYRDLVFAHASGGMRFDATVKGSSLRYRAGLVTTSTNTFGYTMPALMAVCIREAP
jgi:hypothetical protein